MVVNSMELTVMPSLVPVVSDQDLFERFLRLSVADGTASLRTLQSYRDGLAIFLGHCKAQSVAPAMASFDHLSEYRLWLVNKGYKRSTIRLRLTAVRVFYTALQRWGRRQDNPAAGLKAPRDLESKVSAILRKALSPDEVGKLESVLPEPIAPQDKRDRAIIYLAIYHGLRVAELSNLSHLSLDASFTWLNVVGKGSKQRRLMLSPEARKDLMGWIDVPSNDDTPLFYRLDRPGKMRLGVRGIQRIADFYLTKSGLKQRGRSIHALRHTHAVLARLGGAQLEAIAEEMGHSDIGTTDLYSRAAAAFQDNPASAVARALSSGS